MADDTGGLKVVPFTRGNVHDIPSGLRDLAELIEQGCVEGEILGLTDATHFAWIATNSYGQVECGLLGADGDRYRAAGIMLAGANKLTKEQTP